MRFLPAGDSALLVELQTLDEVLGYYAALTADPPEGVIDIVPAARTVLVTAAPQSARSGAEKQQAGAPSVSLQQLERALRAVVPVAGQSSGGDLLEIPVVYDGEDLQDVAELLGCSTSDVIERHTGEEWTVAFCGFAPGFGYLTASASWDIPRRKSPRTKVPTGAVALAGEFSGVYPRESPGGWQLIGRTDLRVFDQDRDPAALFHPGRRVRFTVADPG
ncbi:allophanate hydrolase subunit 1 [Kribbella qitaiheensis]|uniref:Allophanate hydrolase subunit 1 n=1 Tax=Kribbella qitaiheensis TaxID=1544730 RepID=A0A7G6X9R9_9ACTN|nr:allophanate hydrolase subunit 1 [Kribbella qitaiheensis]QNE22984.1 allophanate hydrolase subunit 1 [Kribbella qitaiheensis]